jgi:ABC-type phosphate transport system substrate-binding protein
LIRATGPGTGARRAWLARSPGLAAARRLVLFALAGVACASSAAPQDRRYVVIVNVENPVDALSRAEVAKLFLDRTSHWKHGAASPVDQSLISAIRAAFSQDVLGYSLPAVKSYWDKRLMSSREVPPPVKSTDAEVIAHVARNKGGIGYVSAATPLEGGVKVLKLQD